MSTLVLDRTARAWPLSPIKLQDQPVLPHGFPVSLQAPMAWTGSDFDSDDDYVISLRPEDVADVEQALRSFKDMGRPADEICKDSFALTGELALRLSQVSDAVHNGRGFCLVRGIDPRRYSEADNALIFAGVASYVGGERSSFRHIYDATHRADDFGEPLRPPELPVKMNFHTDINAGDILALYAQSLSKQGGGQSVASFWKVYNDLVNENPVVLRVLAENWRHELPWGKYVEVFDRPLMHYHRGKLMLAYAKAFLVGSHWDERLPDGAPISAAQHQALAILDAKFEQHKLRLTQQRGDMLFVNNLSIVHARDSFVDDRAQGKYRHIVSVMLRDPQNAWDQPPEVSSYSKTRFDLADARDIITRDEELALRKSGEVRLCKAKNHD